MPLRIVHKICSKRLMARQGKTCLFMPTRIGGYLNMTGISYFKWPEVNMSHVHYFFLSSLSINSIEIFQRHEEDAGKVWRG